MNEKQWVSISQWPKKKKKKKKKKTLIYFNPYCQHFCNKAKFTLLKQVINSNIVKLCSFIAMVFLENVWLLQNDLFFFLSIKEALATSF